MVWTLALVLELLEALLGDSKLADPATDDAGPVGVSFPIELVETPFDEEGGEVTSLGPTAKGAFNITPKITANIRRSILWKDVEETIYWSQAVR